MLGLIGLIIQQLNLQNNEKSPCRTDNYVYPNFFLGPAVAPRFFNSRIATDWNYTMIASFQHERTNVYSISYFGSLIRFAHFIIMVGEALLPLPPLTARHWYFITQNFEQLALALKNRVALNFFTVLKYFLSLRICEQLALALKNSVPWIHCIEHIFIISILTNFRLPWNFSLYWTCFLHSGFLSNLPLPWKTECALNSLYWIYIFIIQNFEQLVLALKTEFDLNVSSREDAAPSPPPRLVRHCQHMSFLSMNSFLLCFLCTKHTDTTANTGLWKYFFQTSLKRNWSLVEITALEFCHRKRFSHQSLVRWK